MSLQKLAVSNVEYNEWANRRYIDWLSTKPDEVLSKELPSSCPSIIKTLKHMWEAQEFWWGTIAETDDFVKVWEIQDLTQEQIFNGLEKNSAKFAEYVRSLTEADLSTRIKVENQWLKCNLPLYEYIQQVVNHGIYHRGQIVTMARSLGLTDPPNSDYIFWKLRN